MNGMVLARVVDIHPESHAVDLVVMHNSQRLAGVQVLAGVAGTNFGFSDMSLPDNTGYDARNSGTRDIYAVLSWVNATPVVLGFLYPQVAQCLFEEKGRMVYRHGSDAYVTITPGGNMEISHPSGAFVRIADDYQHEDLTGKDYDKKWKIERNTDKATYVSIENAGGGAHKASIVLTPEGDVMIDATGDVRIKSAGDTSVDASGDVKVKAGGDAKVKAGGKGQVVSTGDMIVRSTTGSVTIKSATGLLVV